MKISVSLEIVMRLFFARIAYLSCSSFLIPQSLPAPSPSLRLPGLTWWHKMSII